MGDNYCYGAFTLYGALLKETCSTLTFTCNHKRINVALLNFITKYSLHAGLILVHSPLLKESRLFSFPPLNNMLKFSGCSYLM